MYSILILKNVFYGHVLVNTLFMKDFSAIILAASYHWFFVTYLFFAHHADFILLLGNRLQHFNFLSGYILNLSINNLFLFLNNLDLFIVSLYKFKILDLEVVFLNRQMIFLLLKAIGLLRYFLFIGLPIRLVIHLLRGFWVRLILFRAHI